MRKLLLAFAVFVALSILSNIAHEYGHGLACQAYGGDFEIHVGFLTQSWGICHNDKSPEYVLGLAGGGFGALAAAGSVAVIRRNWYTTGAGAIAVGQVAMMIAETFWHQAYIEGQANTLIGIALMATFGWLAFKTKLIVPKRTYPLKSAEG